MRFFHFVLAVCLALSFLNSDVAAYKKVKCFMPQAPELSLAGVKQVAVLDFRVNGGNSPEVGQFIANEMVKYLLQKDRGITEISGGLLSFSKKEGKCLIPNLETGCFRVIERSRLQAVMAEAGIGEDGLVQADQAKKLGDLAGIDIIITGDASSQTTNTTGTELHEYYEKKQKYTRRVECLQRKVVVVASVRILDARTGEILASRQESSEADDKKCTDSGKEIRDAGEMAGTCASTIAWQFTNLFCPWFTQEEFELEKVQVKETKDEADEFSEAAENLDLPKAYAGFYKLYQSDSYNPQYLYNMGVLYEVSGDFGKAKEMYDGAASLMDEKRYRESSARIGKRVALVEFYSSIERPITPFDMTAAASSVDLTSRYVVVKGSKSARFDFYATPNPAGESVAKVPGGVRLKVIEEKDGWVHVELLGGKQGYISTEKVERTDSAPEMKTVKVQPTEAPAAATTTPKALKLTPAELEAAYRAVGLTEQGKQLDAVCENDVDPDVVVVDLNNDGSPEVFILAHSRCYGNAGGELSLLIKDKQGLWQPNLGFPAGGYELLTTSNLGYPDIAIGGPGLCSPVWRWNGSAYDIHKRCEP